MYLMLLIMCYTPNTVYDNDEFELVMKKAEEWSSLTHRWETNKNVSEAPLVVLFQRFTLSTSL